MQGTYSQMIENIASVIIHTLYTSIPYNNSIAIYDIDETLINTDNSPIQPIINTFNHAKALGIQPVLITARVGTDLNVHKTQLQLSHHNITGYHSLYFRPSIHSDPYQYKLDARKDLYDKGYTAILSVGDAPWDIGEYGGIGFRLPILQSN